MLVLKSYLLLCLCKFLKLIFVDIVFCWHGGKLYSYCEFEVLHVELNVKLQLIACECVGGCLYTCSPFAYMDPLSANLTHMFCQLYRDALTEYTYAAELAGLGYNIQNTIYGLIVSR